MILRRVTKHVRDQNWFAVFIDFIIVVVGVFIGIQVANWNEGRQTRADETEIIQRIREDFDRIKVDSQYGREFHEGVVNDSKVLVKALRSNVLNEADVTAIKRALYMGLIFQTSADRSGTTRELLASGRANILRDKKLLDELVAYENFLDRYEQAVPYITGAMLNLREITRSTFQYDLESPFFSQNLSPTDIQPPIIDFDFKTMTHDAAIKGAFEEMLYLQNIVLMWRLRIDDKITSIQSHLEAKNVFD